MGEITRNHNYTVDLNKPLMRQGCGILLAEGDNNGDCFCFTLMRGGVAVNPGNNAEVTAFFIRQDGNTVYITGESTKVTNNRVSVTLPESCYASGRFSLAVKVEIDGEKTTVAIIDGHVRGVQTDTWIDPGTTVPSLAELYEQIKAIETDVANKVQLKPEFAQSEEWLNANGDTSKLYVLPDGYIYAYIATKTEGGTVPNFTNLLEEEGSRIEEGRRFSQSNHVFKASEYGGNGYVIPIPKGTVTLRIRYFQNAGYQYLYFGETDQDFQGVITSMSPDASAMETQTPTELAFTFNNSLYNYATFTSKPTVEIVTVNEEITYTTTEGGTSYKWASTGHAFVPADYENRIVTLENGLGDAEQDIKELQDKINNVSISGNANATTAFSVPAYCPVPQLPADGSNGSDFDYHSVTTQDAYDYMDALCNKYTQYITKQTMGKDESGVFDHNRYILSKAYWRAWQKENYPRMYAWENGSKLIYSVSVSPRVGDNMYSTPYVGTVYNTVTAVNSAAKTESTRTVNGLVFTRNEDFDMEPTIAYTKPPQYPGAFATQAVYNSAFSALTTVSSVGDGYFVGRDGFTYTRYPFEDRRQDKSKPMSIFILSNEHGMNGDDPIPSFVVMRMAKDLCKNTENQFLQWMKENCMVTMIPVGNPWGYARYLDATNKNGYVNSNGVNINRNYDTPGWSTSDTNYGTEFGDYPGSEIETQHIMNTMRLCKPAVGISMHSPGFASDYKDMPDNAYFIYQGQGFDPARVHKITETMYSNYGMGGGANCDYAQHYEMCGKSPAYIQYVGAVGGLTETVTQENGTNNVYTSLAMEQAYTQMLLFLQCWCEEALEKEG